MSDSYDFGWDKKYCYLGSDVLINKLNIVDSERLEELERQVTTIKLARVANTPPTGVINLAYLKLLHKLVFQDIYSCDGLCAPKTKELNRLISSNSARLL